jgi:hypothetical protein
MLTRREFGARASALLAACAIYRPARAAAAELLEREKLDAEKQRILELNCHPDPWLAEVLEYEAGGPISLGDYLAIDPRGRAIRATQPAQVVGVATRCEGRRVFVRRNGYHSSHSATP